MFERITDLMASQNVLTGVEADLSTLNQTEQELSTGKRVNQPSDDPYAASVILQLNGNLSQQSNYQSNVNDGTAWLNTASSALTDINNAVQKVRELVVEGANGTNSATDEAGAAAEVNQLIDEIKQDANTQYNGNYVFSGSAVTTAPYQAGSNDTYQGNSGTVSRQVGPGAQNTVQISVDLGTQVLGNGSGSGDGLLLDTLRQIATDLGSGNSGALGSTDLQNLTNNMSSLEQLQATVGATTDRLTAASSQIQSLTSADNSQLANTQDANMAQVATQYSTETAAFQAALQSGAKIIQESLVNFLNL
jgi:flagellar hook-associated protein 3 FlgL